MSSSNYERALNALNDVNAQLRGRTVDGGIAAQHAANMIAFATLDELVGIREALQTIANSATGTEVTR